MNPFEHGEVFVTDDGGETDLDLGHYERFIDENLHRGLERHDRLDLLGGARRRAPGRLPRQDRAGHPAHHRRDQAPHHPPRRRRRRRRHHRGRRHGRRHRDPAVPRGHPAVPPRRRPRQRLLRPRHAGAVHRPVRRAEDQAHAALGHRAAQPRHPARRHRVPQRARRSPTASSARSPTCATCPSNAVVNAADARNLYEIPLVLHEEGLDDRGLPASCGSTTATVDLTEWEALVDRVEAADRARCASASSASTSACPTPTCRSSRRSSTAASTTAPRSRSTGSRPRTSRACWPTGRLRDLDGIVIPGGFGERGIEGKIAAAGYAREHDIPCLGPVPRHAGDDHRVRPQRARPRRRQLERVRPADAAPGHRPHGRASATSPTRAARCASAPTSPSSTPGSQVAEAYGETVVSERHRHRYEFNPRVPRPVRGSRLRAARARRPTAGWSSSSSSTATRSGSAPRPTPSSRAGPTGRRRCSASSSAPR